MVGDLFYVGITHDTAPLAVRERAKPDADKQREMLARLHRLAQGRMALATCERFEIYAHATCCDASEWVSTLADWFHWPARLLARYVRVEGGAAVAEHLLRVAAGLKSRIVGEAPILGQVRSAFQQANECGALDAELSAVCRSAIRTGRRVRHETALGDGARSIATLAVDRISAQRGSVRDLQVVVIGSGRLSAEVVADLTLRRAGRLVVVGRNLERAARLASRFGAAAYPFEWLPRALREADAAVACTSAPSYVVDAATIGPARAKPLCLVDLSVPRNIDPTLTHTRNIELTHLDGLSCGRSAHCDALIAANRIVQEELRDLFDWLRARKAAPLIVEAIRQAEIERALGRGGDPRALHARILRLKAEAAA